MKILITSGGTTESIDAVRGITNHASGALGKRIAERFLSQGHQVTLVTTQQALKPQKQANLDIHIITDVASLMATLEPLVKTHDVFIHSMAVSDYTPVYMTDFEALEKLDNPRQLLAKTNSEKKISSAADYQVLLLKKTPKVISYIKEWNPEIHLIGFKLLVDVSQDELFKIARQSLHKNQADFIVANDLKQISGNDHLAYLVDESSEEVARTKQEIADRIYERVISHA